MVAFSAAVDFFQPNIAKRESLKAAISDQRQGVPIREQWRMGAPCDSPQPIAQSGLIIVASRIIRPMVKLDELRILIYPAAQLRARANSIDDINDEVRSVANRMIELMRQAKGVGLAAPQVGLAWRMFVTETPDDPTPRVYINPKLTFPSKQRSVAEEGCLSLPGIHVDIERPVAVTMTALDLAGAERTVSSEGFEARVWQHEFDHLNGVLIIDKMTPMDRLATRKSLKELQATAGGAASKDL
jgi:peptide deformylase